MCMIESSGIFCLTEHRLTFMVIIEIEKWPFQTDTSVNWRHTLQIFRELGFAPIGAKFPPITAPHVLCTVKQKFSNMFKTFLVIVVLIYLSYFRVKKRLLNSYYDMLWTIFHLFQYYNFTTYCYVRTLEEKNFEKMTSNFFLTEHFCVFFRIFFRIFFQILCYISVGFTDILKI